MMSGLGSLAAAGMFLMTLSFLVTTPGIWLWVDGFPAPSEAAAFLLKDVFFLGAAICTARRRFPKFREFPKVGKLGTFLPPASAPLVVRNSMPAMTVRRNASSSWTGEVMWSWILGR